MVKFGRSVRPSGQQNLAVQFLFIRPSGCGRMGHSPGLQLLIRIPQGLFHILCIGYDAWQQYVQALRLLCLTSDPVGIDLETFQSWVTRSAVCATVICLDVACFFVARTSNGIIAEDGRWKVLWGLIYIYANLVILATAVTYYQLSGGESGTLRWLRSLLDKLDISC